jgi:hypothetical protein
MKYGVDYFIDFFKKIPDENFRECINGKGSKVNCPYGHCIDAGLRYKFLNIWVDVGYSIADVVWNYVPKYRHESVKQRILAALYDIREKELSEANIKAVEKIVNTISEPINV